MGYTKPERGAMPKFTNRVLAALKVEDGRKDRLVFDSACHGLGVLLRGRGLLSRNGLIP